MSPQPAILELTSISKSYPGVRALEAVSLRAWPGQVHALVGANGAGKSTLIQIIGGVVQPDAGEIRWHGSPVRIHSPTAARKLGIAVAFQESELLDTLSVAENVARLRGWSTGPNRGEAGGRRQHWGLLDWRAIERDARKTLARSHLDWDVKTPAGKLTVAQRQLLQIAVAVSLNANLVILDEPTSALSQAESHWLFEQVRCLKSDGAAILYVSHRQEEIFSLADAITVLRDGHEVWHGAVDAITPQRLIEKMISITERDVAAEVASTGSESGRSAPCRPAKIERSAGPVRLRISGLSDAARRYDKIDFEIRAGEIIGIYGLIGAGRTEFAQGIAGLRARASGTIELDGRRVEIHSPEAAIQLGIAYLPEDRLHQGVFRGLSVRANTVISSLHRWGNGLWLRKSQETQAAREIVSQLRVQLRSLDQPIGQLSGGNQQKIILGRSLLTRPKVLILDEPTRGVDVSAKAEIHQILRSLADSGVAIVMISSELAEVCEHCDRVSVFRQGSIQAHFDPRVTPATEIGAAAFLPIPSDADTPKADNPKADNPKADIQALTTTRGDRDSMRLEPTSRFSHWSEMGLAGIVLLLFASMRLTGESLAWSTWGSAVSMWVLLALSAAMPMFVRGIDISVGSVVALSAATASVVLQLDVPIGAAVPLAVGASVLVGVACGLFNAACCDLGKLHPIVVTLGTMTIYRGIVILMLQGKAVTGLPPAYSQFTNGTWLVASGAVWMTIVFAVMLAIWLGRTRTGRDLYAVGSNPVAATYLGVRGRRSWFIAFAVGGGLAGMAGALQLGHSGQMQAQLGAGWELQAIAAAVVGGVSLSGGRGNVVGIVLGAVLLRLINSAMVRWGVSERQFELVAGLVLLVAIVGDQTWRRRAS